MELKVYGRNVKVTERLQEHVESKAKKFEQLGDHVTDIEVKFSKDGHIGPNTIRVEITVVGRGPILRAEASGSDKFAVFDDTYGKLLERLRRARDRRKAQKHGGRSPLSVSEATGSLPIVTDQTAVTEIHAEDIPVEEAAFDNEYALTDDVQSPLEIRRKSFPAEKLTAEEAVDRMELVGHDFYLFVDADTNTPSAVYRRKGWSYGVISLSDQ
ncbi:MULTISPECIES: ribosome hibernation-promoting factor, HPF/YfiA family [unclassified Rothia (in: high G+C Gram-positive bacteria)]|uniref:ribosome hibernation-promoting factor, HPF/YfiA family n=1 Tax=unclassified Rothia (in: high G+C Gram-positive bacteria) TaxID=2689056 RepID=UPI0019571B83|nr:ribosome-associated translation inhibitor RaiA [Rothia sp. ZJ932]MBM7050846.1 ribosome-associated translation inhibitor RaiA [Rothia sp. ZJ1223]QRZ61020.1 ribosome-associated translation inhibitor RaiA [Rothia sp. ZJ932]